MNTFLIHRSPPLVGNVSEGGRCFDECRLVFGASFDLVFQCLEVGFVLFVSFDGFLLFAVLVEFEIKLRRPLFHLLMAYGTRMGQQWEAVGGDDLIHVVFPEGHKDLLLVFGPQFGGFQEDDHQSVEGVYLVLGQIVFGN